MAGLGTWARIFVVEGKAELITFCNGRCDPILLAPVLRDFFAPYACPPPAAAHLVVRLCCVRHLSVACYVSVVARHVPTWQHMVCSSDRMHTSPLPWRHACLPTQLHATLGMGLQAWPSLAHTSTILFY